MTEFLSIGQVAAELGVSTQTVRDWEAQGLIRSVRMPGKHRRFTREQLDQAKRTMGLLPAVEAERAG